MGGRSSSQRGVFTRPFVVCWSVIALIAATVVVVGTSTAGAAERPSAWCDVWSVLHPYNGKAVTNLALPDGTLVTADKVTAPGATCQDDTATVKLDGAVFTYPGTTAHGRSKSDATATTSFGEGSFVVDNVSIGSFNVELRARWDSYYGFVLYFYASGWVNFTINGTNVPLYFQGEFQDSNNYSFSVATDSAGVVIPGFAPKAATFSGSMTNSYGVVSVAVKASAPKITFKNLTITDASLDITAGSNTSTKMAIAGTATFGPSTASMSLQFEIGTDGALVSGSGSASIDLVGTLSDGSTARLTGSASVSVANNQAVIGVKASGQLGDLKLTDSSLTATLSGSTASFTGSMTVAYPGGTATFNGALTFDSTSASITSFSGSAAASYSGTTSDGTAVALDGSLAVSLSSSGAIKTVLTGSGKFGPWLASNGNFVLTGAASSATMSGGLDLTINSTKVSVAGSLKVNNSTITALDFSGSVSNLTIGDVVVLSGSLEIHRQTDGSLKVTIVGQVKADGVVLDSTFAVEIASDGTLVGLTGSSNVAFNATSASGAVAITGGASLTMTKGVATVKLTGSGTIAGISVANVKLELNATSTTVNATFSADATIGGGTVKATGSMTAVNGALTALSFSGSISAPLSGAGVTLAGSLAVKLASDGSLTVSADGGVTVNGGSVINGSFALVLGSNGSITSVTGAGQLNLSGTDSSGTTSSLSGSASLKATSSSVSVSFTGSGSFGGYAAASVTGSITGSGSTTTIAFSSNLTITDFGVVAASGSASFANGSVTALNLTGSVNVTFGSTTVAGTATIGLTNGKVGATVSGTVTNGTQTLAGASLTLKNGVATMSASVTIPNKLTANVTGTLYYGTAAELSGLTVTNKAGTSVAASTGDLVLSAPSVAYTPGSGWAMTVAFSLSRVGSVTWMTVSGDLKLSEDAANNKLKFSGDIDSTGVANLTASGALSLGGNYFTSFSATVVATATDATITGSGCLTGPDSLSACMNMKFAISNGVIDWFSISGTGSFRLFGVLFNNVSFTLSKSAGGYLTATARYQVDFWFIPLYWANFNITFNTDGSCRTVKVTDSSIIIGGIMNLLLSGSCTGTTSTTTTTTSTTTTTAAPTTTTTVAGATTTTVAGATTTTTAASSGISYEATVSADAPIRYWRMQDASGAVANSGSVSGSASVSGTVTRQVAGIGGTTNPDYGYQLNGTSGAVVDTTTTFPTSYTLEVWIKTTDTNGGGIIGSATSPGCSGSATGMSVYMTSAGTIAVGASSNGGSPVIGKTTSAYNDGTWHHVVVTYSSSSTKLYIDGSSTAAVTVSGGSANSAGANWMVGCLNNASTMYSGLPGIGGTHYLSGVVDEVAVYNKVLTTTQIAAHRAAGIKSF